MKARLIIAYLLNIFDLVMTNALVARFGLDIEVNPIMRWARGNDLATFIKTVIVGLALAALHWAIKKKPKYNWTSWLVLGIYVVLAVYHIIIVSVI